MRTAKVSAEKRLFKPTCDIQNGHVSRNKHDRCGEQDIEEFVEKLLTQWLVLITEQNVESLRF